MRLGFRIRQFINGGFRSLVYRFLLFFLLISLLIQSINWITYRVNLGYFQDELKDNYAKSLTSVASQLNGTFTGIYNSNFLLSLDPDTMQLFSSDYALGTASSYAVVPQSIRSLNRIRLMNDTVDRAFIYKRREGLVVSNDGTYGASDFFSRFGSLDLYSQRFWETYPAAQHPFRILPPSTSAYRSGSVYLPVVQTSIAEYRSNDLYVIYLKLGPLVRQLVDSKLTPNSELFILDDSGTPIASTVTDPGRELGLAKLALQTQREGRTRLKVDGRDSMAIYATSQFVFKRMDMVAFVPQSDIRRSMEKIENWGLGMAMTALIASLLLSILFSLNLYTPLQRLIAKLSPATGPPANEYKLLDREFRRMMDDMGTLSSNLSHTAPLAIERWFVRLLKYNRAPDEAEIGPLLARGDIVLPEAGFAVAIVRFKFAPLGFDPNPRSGIDDRLAQIVRELLPPTPTSLLVELEPDILAVIANVPPDSAAHDFYDSLSRETQRLRLSEDKTVRSFAIGVGSVHRGYAGAQRSYLEAMKALWRISSRSEQRIRYYSGEEETPAGAAITDREEKKIVNLLLTCKRMELYGLLREIIERAVRAGLSDISARELYLNLYMAGAQALKQGDLMLPDPTYRDSMRTLVLDRVPGADDIEESITGFYEQIMGMIGVGARQVPQAPASFKAYIDEHYREDIHLEYLAEKFNTSANYMSRLIKKELGVSFQQYLQELRIRKAKEMLRETDLYVQDIWPAVGFTNRNSFIRTFKNLEGISPIEYRARCAISNR